MELEKIIQPFITGVFAFGGAFLAIRSAQKNEIRKIKADYLKNRENRGQTTVIKGYSKNNENRVPGFLFGETILIKEIRYTGKIELLSDAERAGFAAARRGGQVPRRGNRGLSGFLFRLVMPLDGFLRSLDVQEQVRAKLIVDGVIKVEQKEQAVPIETAH